MFGWRRSIPCADLIESGQIASDDGVLAVLRDRMGHDSNPYIRLQSAAVIRELDSR